MTGVDVHVDTNIGKHITALGQTLTTLTGKVPHCFLTFLIFFKKAHFEHGPLSTPFL